MAFMLNGVSKILSHLIHAALTHLFTLHLFSLYEFTLSILHPLWMDIRLSSFLLLQMLHFAFAHEHSLGSKIRNKVAVV